MRRPVVGVFGGSAAPYEVLTVAHQVGEGIARRGWHLLTGAGPGVMEAASRGFCSTTPREGLCLGILPVLEDQSLPRGYPNPYVELSVLSALSSDPELAEPQRNWINARTAWGALVLPGQAGTRQELELCRRFGTPTEELARPEEVAEALQRLSVRLSDPATR